MTVLSLLGCFAAFTACAIALVWAGAFIYQRGTARGTVTPPSPFKAKPSEPTAVKPEPPQQPAYPCPWCRKVVKWILAKDESVWTCTQCENEIAGPKPRITV